MKRLVYILLLVIISISSEAQRLTRQGYVDQYKDWAIEEMKRVGIPASITLAQGILESDCGNSILATESNNHFGIKCHSDWTGERSYHDDDKNNECFRKYESAQQSFIDHSDFIKNKSRYKSLFDLDITDYQSWALGLKSAGYATDPGYAQKLIDIIEEMGLSAFDQGSTTNISKPTEVINDVEESISNRIRIRKDADFVINPLHEHNVEYNNGVKYITTINGDSFEQIAREFHLMVSELLHYNDLDASADIKEIKYIYIRSKRNRAHPECVTHTVSKGETSWSIAHKYGIKLRKLRKYNHLVEGQEPTIGQTLNLRSSK